MLPALLLSFLSAAAAASVPAAGARRRWQPGTTPIRGVNLGSQFIIEPWMAGDAWHKMGCDGTDDEWECVKKLGSSADAAFEEHWKTWITKDDINRIKSLGLNTIRIPIGFWIHEELVREGEYYPKGGLKYLDQLVGWASDADLQIIIDLHGAPGSQSIDQSFTGHKTSSPGFYTADNYERATQFLEWMAERIHTTHAYRMVYALEVLNEPVRTWESAQATDMVQNFYPQAWTRVREREAKLNTQSQNLLNLIFMADSWGSGNPTEHLPASRTFTSFDDHRYLKWDPSLGQEPGKDDYIRAACSDNRGGPDTIVGEWSISVADQVENGPEFGIDKAGPDQIAWYRSFWAAQAQSFEKSGGWVFWSWKCNWIAGKDEWRWCYESAVNAGVIPKDAGSAASISPC